MKISLIFLVLIPVLVFFLKLFECFNESNDNSDNDVCEAKEIEREEKEQPTKRANWMKCLRTDRKIDCSMTNTDWFHLKTNKNKQKGVVFIEKQFVLYVFLFEDNDDDIDNDNDWVGHSSKISKTFRIALLFVSLFSRFFILS